MTHQKSDIMIGNADDLGIFFNRVFPSHWIAHDAHGEIIELGPMPYPSSIVDEAHTLYVPAHEYDAIRALPDTYCGTCKGTRVVYDTGHLWSEALPCPHCPPHP